MSQTANTFKQQNISETNHNLEWKILFHRNPVTRNQWIDKGKVVKLGKYEKNKVMYWCYYEGLVLSELLLDC